MLDKVGYTFTPSTPEACEFKDRMVYITVLHSPTQRHPVSKKVQTKPKTPKRKKPTKTSPQALKPIAFLFILFCLMV